MIPAFPPVAGPQLETFLARWPDVWCPAANGNVQAEDIRQRKTQEFDPGRPSRVSALPGRPIDEQLSELFPAASFVQLRSRTAAARSARQEQETIDRSSVPGWCA
jgi:hypothetical protein